MPRQRERERERLRRYAEWEGNQSSRRLKRHARARTTWVCACTRAHVTGRAARATHTETRVPHVHHTGARTAHARARPIHGHRPRIAVCGGDGYIERRESARRRTREREKRSLRGSRGACAVKSRRRTPTAQARPIPQWRPESLTCFPSNLARPTPLAAPLAPTSVSPHSVPVERLAIHRRAAVWLWPIPGIISYSVATRDSLASPRCCPSPPSASTTPAESTRTQA